jgi:hypothetical protein
LTARCNGIGVSGAVIFNDARNAIGVFGAIVRNDMLKREKCIRRSDR